MAKRSVVAVASVGESVQETVREAMMLAGFQQHLERGKATSLKVNLGWDLFIPGSITSPWVLEGVIRTLKDWTGPLYLVESDQVLENIEKTYRQCKLDKLCEQYGVQWINMSRSESVPVPVKNGAIFQTIELPKILLDTQVVTIPVMKTHAKTQITGAIKNQWGCISKMRHNYHLVLSDALADINSVVRPAFAVMDATIALEGNGPKSGSPKFVNKILASPDIVAIDTVQAKMMGLDPSSIEHLHKCAQRCLGTNRLEEIEIKGETNALQIDLQFRPAKHNLVSKIEEACRRSALRKIVFDTPLFQLMLTGAKFWYLIWYYLVSGRKHWKTVLNHPRYGLEWKGLGG
jgi:uncharacterized protein (DUF362 family)